MNHTTLDTEDLIRSVERARVRALVDGDTGAARQYHGDHFELITPIGVVLTREGYLGAIDSGQINYLSWDPADIAVRLHGKTAVIRYRAELEVEFGGHPVPRTSYWHTDSYELRDGAWQTIWSQATQIR